jgi:sulfate transport system ATP-binding protein
VTHDQEEALEVSDRVVIMNNGRIVQIGTPADVFHNPSDEFVMQFLGKVNVFGGRVEGGKAVFDGLEVAYPHDEGVTGQPARALVRPFNLAIHPRPSGRPHFEATITHINAAGPIVKVELIRDSGEPVFVEITRGRYETLGLSVGSRAFLSPREVRVFVDSAGDRSIHNLPDPTSNKRNGSDRGNGHGHPVPLRKKLTEWE